MNYKIQKTEPRTYFITESKSFTSVEALIDFYQNNDGLKMRLRNPVLREKEEERERDQWEIARDTVTRTKLLGTGHFGEVKIVIFVVVVVFVDVVVCQSPSAQLALFGV